MALLKFFKTPRHQKFEYRPRHWDPRKEELQQRIQQAKARNSGDPEAMKARISSGMRRSFGKENAQARSRGVRRSNMILLGVIGALLLVSYTLLTVYLPEIINMIE